jgi:multidrug efflux pump subunit AcrB
MSNNNNTSNSNSPNNSGERKEFWLSSFSIKNSTSVMVIIFLATIMGIQAYIGIPKEAEPDITIPNVFVVTIYPGVSPEDMESLITRKIEDELSGIPDVKEITSTSSEGYSNINIEFQTGINMSDALQRVREKVDFAKPELPAEAEDPIIQEINLSDIPVVQVNMSGEYSLDKLKLVAEDLQDRLEALPNVLEATLAGGLEREVKVDVDLARLKYYDLTFSDIIKAIQTENVTIPGGSIDVGTKKFLLRVPGEYENPKPIEDIVVKAEDDKPIYVRDLANVTFGFKERESYAYLDSSPVITLSVKKRTGKNIIETVESVQATVDEFMPYAPPTTVAKLTSDRSSDVRNMVSSLENNIISGLLLVVGVLLFFLGIRNASFVGVAIPLSMFISFIIIAIIGMSMNMIVLFSLILALGMLVDNAIVVVENIYRYLEEGYDNTSAAIYGTGEVAIPIITGTLTTLAAFFPMLFWPGIVGEFMGYLPKTLIITLSSSLFVALVINPVLCALFMKVNTEEKKPTMSKTGSRILTGFGSVVVLIIILLKPAVGLMLVALSLIVYLSYIFFMKPVGNWFQRDGLEKIIQLYKSTLVWAINHNWSVVAIAIATLISSFVIFGFFNKGIEFFPEDIPPRQVFVQVEAPTGTNVDFTRDRVLEIEKRIATIPNPQDLQSIVTSAGQFISNNPNEGGGDATHRGTVVLNFKEFQMRSGDVFQTLDYLRDNLSRGMAGAKITIEKPASGPPTGKPVNLEIAGVNMDKLKEISENVLDILESDPVYAKMEGLESNLPDSRPEIRFNVDREKAAIYGLSTQLIGSTIRQAVNGIEASKYRDGKDEYDITVRLAEKYREQESSIGDIEVMNDGRSIPLSAVASWEVTSGLGGIKRKDNKRVITVSADVRDGFQANAVLEEVQVVLDNYMNNLPSGYTMGFTGQQQEQDEASAFLSNAFLIALFLIFFILISQFNSVYKPLIVLSSVVMSTAGVLLGLVIFQMPFGVIMSGIGVISLAGVVVNNAIVLIDYIDVLRYRDKMSIKEALIQAGVVRFRPVVLTAITTTLGLVPLAIGFNIDFLVLVGDPVHFFSNISEFVYMGGEQAAWWAPMAIAVISGLVFSTFLTLILVPVLYNLFNELGIKLKAVFAVERKEEATSDLQQA